MRKKYFTTGRFNFVIKKLQIFLCKIGVNNVCQHAGIVNFFIKIKYSNIAKLLLTMPAVNTWEKSVDSKLKRFREVTESYELILEVLGNVCTNKFPRIQKHFNVYFNFSIHKKNVFFNYYVID